MQSGQISDCGEEVSRGRRRIVSLLKHNQGRTIMYVQYVLYQHVPVREPVAGHCTFCDPDSFSRLDIYLLLVKRMSLSDIKYVPVGRVISHNSYGMTSAFSFMYKLVDSRCRPISSKVVSDDYRPSY